MMNPSPIKTDGKVKTGIKIYNTASIEPTNAFPIAETIDYKNTMLLEFSKALKKLGAVMVRDNGNMKLFNYNGKTVKIEGINDMTSMVYFGKNITFELKISNISFSKELGNLRTTYFSLGTYFWLLLYDDNKKEFDVRNGIPYFGTRFTLEEFLKKIFSLEKINWPGTNLPFYAKDPNLFNKNTGLEKAYGKIIYRSSDGKILHDVNALYATTPDDYQIATIFAVGIPFKPVKINKNSIDIKIKNKILSIDSTMTLYGLMKNYDLAKKIMEAGDLLEEYEIFEFV